MKLLFCQWLKFLQTNKKVRLPYSRFIMTYQEAQTAFYKHYFAIETLNDAQMEAVKKALCFPSES